MRKPPRRPFRHLFPVAQLPPLPRRSSTFRPAVAIFGAAARPGRRGLPLQSPKAGWVFASGHDEVHPVSDAPRSPARPSPASSRPRPCWGKVIGAGRRRRPGDRQAPGCGRSLRRSSAIPSALLSVDPLDRPRRGPSGVLIRLHDPEAQRKLAASCRRDRLPLSAASRAAWPTK